MPVGVAQCLELLEVRQLADVDLRGQVSPDRRLEPLSAGKGAAREGPAVLVRVPGALPQEHLEHAVANLQDDAECRVCRSGRFRLRGGNRARLSSRF
jgi:hypothetical protein